MLSITSNKIGKKRGGILSVFHKTISELEKLNTEATDQIKAQEKKIAKEEAEKSALETEQASIALTVSKMKTIIGLDEPTEEKK